MKTNNKLKVSEDMKTAVKRPAIRSVVMNSKITTKPGIYFTEQAGLFELKEWGDNHMLFIYTTKKNKQRRIKVRKAKYTNIIYIGQV